MFDTMTMTKIVGALCGTFLVFLLGNMAAESLYHVGGDSHGAGAGQAYVIEAGEEIQASVEETPDFAEAMLLADAEKGKKIFGKCKACHKVEAGANGVGPTLFDVVDRNIGSVTGFGYSAVLTELPGNWSSDALNEFLTSPKSYAPGTKMSFSGLKGISDRANLVAYLDTLGG